MTGRRGEHKGVQPAYPAFLRANDQKSDCDSVRQTTGDPARVITKASARLSVSPGDREGARQPD